jgi:hypothetical protein
MSLATLTTRRFWADAFERALKTLLQTFLALSGLAAATDLASVSWQAAAAAAGIAAATSLLTSVVSVLQDNSISPASLVPPVS